MGLYAGGGDLDIAAIAAEMRTALALWFNGAIKLIDPNVGDGNYNRFTGVTSGDEPTEVWAGPSLIQPLYSTDATDSGFKRGELRGIRFQLPRDIEPQGSIHSGLQVIVTSGGEDPTLENYQYVVNSGVNSSLMWHRTIEASIDAGNPN